MTPFSTRLIVCLRDIFGYMDVLRGSLPNNPKSNVDHESGKPRFLTTSGFPTILILNWDFMLQAFRTPSRLCNRVWCLCLCAAEHTVLLFWRKSFCSPVHTAVSLPCESLARVQPYPGSIPLEQRVLACTHVCTQSHPSRMVQRSDLAEHTHTHAEA